MKNIPCQLESYISLWAAPWPPASSPCLQDGVYLLQVQQRPPQIRNLQKRQPCIQNHLNLKNLQKDIYLDQAVKVVNDMIGQQNLAKGKPEEPAKKAF